MELKFKVGPAKLRNGDHAEIFKIIEGQEYSIKGECKISNISNKCSVPSTWTIEGKYYSDEVINELYLMPNAEPKSWQHIIFPQTCHDSGLVIIALFIPSEFKDKKLKLMIEVIE